ncbi:hypothetical protein DFH09DRAFT_1433353 [Mycena vulgaris]|nr:hypothetical protein DFH09DRAFT_1433353 [Mycena vulgaris]
MAGGAGGGASTKSPSHTLDRRIFLGAVFTGSPTVSSSRITLVPVSTPTRHDLKFQHQDLIKLAPNPFAFKPVTKKAENRDEGAGKRQGGTRAVHPTAPTCQLRHIPPKCDTCAALELERDTFLKTPTARGTTCRKTRPNGLKARFRRPEIDQQPADGCYHGILKHPNTLNGKTWTLTGGNHEVHGILSDSDSDVVSDSKELTGLRDSGEGNTADPRESSPLPVSEMQSETSYTATDFDSSFSDHESDAMTEDLQISDTIWQDEHRARKVKHADA